MIQGVFYKIYQNNQQWKHPGYCNQIRNNVRIVPKCEKKWSASNVKWQNSKNNRGRNINLYFDFLIVIISLQLSIPYILYYYGGEGGGRLFRWTVPIIITIVWFPICNLSHREAKQPQLFSNYGQSQYKCLYHSMFHHIAQNTLYSSECNWIKYFICTQPPNNNKLRNKKHARLTTGIILMHSDNNLRTWKKEIRHTINLLGIKIYSFLKL